MPILQLKKLRLKEVKYFAQRTHPVSVRTSMSPGMSDLEVHASNQYPILQWFLAGGDFAPRCLAVSGDISVCHSWR